MTSGTRGANSASNQCQNVTIHNVSTIKLTNSLNAHASVDDDRKDTDLSNQAEVDTVDEARSAEDSDPADAQDRAEAPKTGSSDVEQEADQKADGAKDADGDQDADTDEDTGASSGAEPAADVLVLAAAPGRDGAETPEILLEGLVPPSSSALEDLDIDTLAALLPPLGFSGAQDSVVRLPASSVSTTKYHGPATILVVGVGTGWADALPGNWSEPAPRSWRCPLSRRRSSPPSLTEQLWAPTPGRRRRTGTARGGSPPPNRPPR